jgi:hypothetical protein
MQCAAKLIVLCRKILLIEDAVLGDGPLKPRKEYGPMKIASNIEFTYLRKIF